jgi:hypothetical protein
MNKIAIKVIKRNKMAGWEKQKLTATSPKVESDIQHTLVTVINNWISERRENRQVEKAFSDGKISAWRITSKDFKEIIG